LTFFWYLEGSIAKAVAEVSARHIAMMLASFFFMANSLFRATNNDAIRMNRN
jgi:hypothetical protein